MKIKIYKSTSILVTALCMLIFLGAQQSHAQETTIYSQTFNSAYPNWPTGWSASPSTGGWEMDTSTANQSYVPTSGMFGYPGASGGAMVDISNPSNGDTGTYSVTSSSISTVGYSNITAIWGSRLTKHFADSGSAIKSFAWSSNGGSTWNTASFTQNPNDSYWHLANDSVPIQLPAGAAGQSSIIFRWVAFIHSNAGSGTFRFDDFIVGGTVATGINMLNMTSSVNLFPNPASDFVTIDNPTGKNYTVRLSDITGKILRTVYISNNKNRIDISDFAPGFYMAQLISSNNNSQVQVIKLVIIR